MAPPVRNGQARLTDTIFANSSGRPPAAIAVIRVSGPAAFTALEALAGPLPPLRTASLRTLRDGALAIDSALVLRFAGPRSATGEDLVELHCHGGRAVIAAVEAALFRQPGLRRAEAGEFTRRALMNGRIDLMEAEGLADLLSAETEAQRVAAMAAAEGQLSTMVRAWLDRTAMLSAEVEALLDYAEEDDVVAGGATGASIHRGVTDLADEIDRVLSAPSVERLRDGVRVVIGGPPNAGKSTLLNLLTEREAAIVSPISGTTRDRVEAPVLRHGIPILLIDTAGLVDTSDLVEAIGVERARQAIDTADLLLWLGDEPPSATDAIWIHARCDQAERQAVPPGRDLGLSAFMPDTVAALWNLIAERAAERMATGEGVPAMRDVQRATCHQAATALRYPPYEDLLIVAERLGEARRCFARLLGIDATESMLDALFSRFCVGK